MAGKTQSNGSRHRFIELKLEIERPPAAGTSLPKSKKFYGAIASRNSGLNGLQLMGVFRKSLRFDQVPTLRPTLPHFAALSDLPDHPPCSFGHFHPLVPGI